jgi:hypothetical protein
MSAVSIRVLKGRIFSIFSVTTNVVSDNAKSFVSREFKQFCFALGITHVTTTPY